MPARPRKQWAHSIRGTSSIAFSACLAISSWLVATKYCDGSGARPASHSVEI